ncbi:MAG: hypothetical protein GY708_30510 [Actinomycetia bacterium]|nr:hypothetical protein [Actinomycetes bacterium]MCP4962304.1 hypothetical protein [Actinomycetes bacterium]
MNQQNAENLRKRLVEIGDELRDVASNDFARRHELLTESDVVRAALDEEVGEDLGEAAAEWAERAGHKGSHEVDYEARKGAIVSPIEPGGNSG